MADLNLKLVISGSNDGAIRALNQVVGRAQASGKAFERADNSGQFGKTRAGVESISRSLSRLQGIGIGFGSFRILSGLAADAARAIDLMKGVEARLKLVAKSWGDYAKAMEGARRIAFASGTEVSVSAELIGRIADPIQRMGGQQEDVLAVTEAVNNSLRVQGTSASEAAGPLLQLAQAMGSGVLRGDELNSILEGMPRLARAIADGLGVTISQLRQLGAAGALTSQQVIKAIQSQQAALTEESARVPISVGGAWTNATEGIKAYLAELDKTTNLTSAFAAGLNGLAKNIPEVANGLARVAVLIGVAFGVKTAAAIGASVVAMRAKSAAGLDAARAAARQAEAELLAAQVLVKKATADVQAAAAARGFTLTVDQAAAASARRTLALARESQQLALWNAATARGAVQSAATAANVGLLARAMAGAAAAGRGLMLFLGGPIGLAVTAITAAALAWDFFSAKAEDAGTTVRESVDEMVRRFDEFSGKAGPNELAESLVELRGRAAELRDQLLDPGFRQSALGKAAEADLSKLEARIVRTDARIKEFRNELVSEKGLLGLGDMRLGAGGLIDQKAIDQLAAFDKLYGAFVSGAKAENGKLVASALEARAAIDHLLSAAKSPAELTGLAERIEAMLDFSKGNATLRSQVEVVLEKRAKAEGDALNVLVTGLEARIGRTQALFGASAQALLAQFNQAAALSRVAAELRNDARSMSAIDTGLRGAGTGAAVAQAKIEMQGVEQLAARKRQLANEQAAATKAAADAEMKAAKDSMDAKITAFQKEVDAGRRSEGLLKDLRRDLSDKYLQQTEGAAAARVEADAGAARQIARVDAESARERSRIAQELYKTIQSKASDALSQYKTYASQVIELDKKIASNRVDTMAAIGSLRRQEMSPKEQVEDLRQELVALQAETRQAMASGKQDLALDLLNRQKAIAQQIGQTRGDGLDPKEQVEEGIAALQEIGGQADAIMRAQRAAAAAAAAEQLESYNQMAAAMNALAAQITTLNQQSAIKLKPEIDEGALKSAISVVQQAFAAAQVKVSVAASAATGDLPGRAYGGPLPGRAPHDRADNMLYWGTPGEWVIQRPAVRYWGRDFLAAINAMRMPKFAFGGQLGGSMINRLRIPRMAPAALSQDSRSEPAVFDLGALGKVRARTSQSTASDVEAVIKRAALMFGRR